MSVMNLKYRTIGMIVGPGFDDSQVVSVAQEFRSRGARVVVIGAAETEAIAVAGKKGTLLRPDTVISKIISSGIDALIIPGGDSIMRLKSDERVLTLVLEINSDSKPIGALGNGPEIVAAAGLLNKRRVTGDPVIKDSVEAASALFLSQGMVVDHNLVTANSDSDLRHFADTISFLLEPATTLS